MVVGKTAQNLYGCFWSWQRWALLALSEYAFFVDFDSKGKILEGTPGFFTYGRVDWFEAFEFFRGYGLVSEVPYTGRVCTNPSKKNVFFEFTDLGEQMLELIRQEVYPKGEENAN